MGIKGQRIRSNDSERVLVVLNAASSPVVLDLTLPYPITRAVDLLNPSEGFSGSGNSLRLTIPPCWARILRLE
jgi:hypothetical protein